MAVRGEARIRPEGPGLRLPEEPALEVVRQIPARQQRPRATLDVDATIAAANKQSALKACEGTVG